MLLTISQIFTLMKWAPNDQDILLLSFSKTGQHRLQVICSFTLSCCLRLHKDSERKLGFSWQMEEKGVSGLGQRYIQHARAWKQGLQFEHFVLGQTD